MSELRVESVQVPGLLAKLRNSEWMIPRFQRDFVWTPANVVQLILSIIDSRPIGMATLWEQSGQTGLDLEPISIVDRDPNTKSIVRKYFTNETINPTNRFAVLDGRQRCTAITMAFGGLRPDTGYFPRYWGRYYLNVDADDPTKRIVFLRESEIKRKGYDVDNSCIAAGLFPLASNIENEEILQQWIRYLQEIRNPSNYPNGSLPENAELDRRNRILQKSFEGIVQTKLAVYVVPESYDLGDICEIFETLNTTGTKVSTVDLIHSWIYSDTATGTDQPIQVRDWLDELGDTHGAVGWSSSADRPELVAQIITACYVALVEKPDQRFLPGRGTSKISSVKAGDLLATPTLHWQRAIENTETLAGFLGDFQTNIADGFFPHSASPYPVSSAIYVALRWHKEFDHPSTHKWGFEEFNALYRAFFWRNALTNRYDQGFLTQLGADIKRFTEILDDRQNHSSINSWCLASDEKLDDLIGKTIPTVKEIEQMVINGRPGGALQRAILLPMVGKTRRDIVDPNISLEYPKSTTLIELHHIYPRDWCRNNQVGELAVYLDKNKSDVDYVNSIANIMPMSRESNKKWKAKNPGQFFLEQKTSYSHSKQILDSVFIDKRGLELLLSGAEGIPNFWKHRASLIATDIVSRTQMVI